MTQPRDRHRRCRTGGQRLGGPPLRRRRLRRRPARRRRGASSQARRGARRRWRRCDDGGRRRDRRRGRDRASRGMAERFGRIDVLHFNPSAFREKDPLAAHRRRAARGRRARRRRAAHRGPGRPAVHVAPAPGSPSPAAWPPTSRGTEAASLGVQKAGVRNLVHSLDTTLKPDGIRAVVRHRPRSAGAGRARSPRSGWPRRSTTPPSRTRSSGTWRCPTPASAARRDRGPTRAGRGP